MKVIIVANVDQRDEILSKNTNTDAELIYLPNITGTIDQQNYDAFFFLSGDMNDIIKLQISVKPVFVNSVVETLSRKNLPGNYSRINGWPGFLQRQSWEVAAGNKVEAVHSLEELGWSATFVKAEPGFIAGRVISMIINEAFFALGGRVSTE